MQEKRKELSDKQDTGQESILKGKGLMDPNSSLADTRKDEAKLRKISKMDKQQQDHYIKTGDGI